MIDEIIQKLGPKVRKYWEVILKTIDPHSIGIIKLSKKLSDEDFDQFLDEIKYLQSLKINLPVVISLKKENETEIVSKVSLKFQEKKVSFNIVSPSNFYIKPITEKIVSIDTAPVIECINDNSVPVIFSVAKHNHAKIYVDSLVIVKELANYLKSKKIIMIGESPILDKSNNVISEIQSEDDLDMLIEEGVITKGMIDNSRHSYDLLKSLGSAHAVQITSMQKNSTGLLEELLGNGSGTKISLPPKIISYPLKDKDQIRKMIDNAFKDYGKKLVPEYFDFLDDKNPTLYLDEKQFGGAITYNLHGLNYLCKLFTMPNYEGIGIARRIIETIILQKKSLVWRASVNNKDLQLFYDRVIKKYMGKKIEKQDYVVYMMGISKEDIESIASLVSSLKPTFQNI
ncbi:hypothetical protein BVX95_02220 [archaeon D22]|nr:hypothetical protein BVX95_02220 [archaeon D22]